MNNNFNIQRVGWLSRWIISTDMPYYRKTSATTFVCVLVIMLFTHLQYFLGGGGETVGEFPAAALCGMLAAVALIGGGNMMYSYAQRQEGLRELHLLPASNLEKFLMRYLLSFLVQIIVVTASILLGDLLQYFVGWILGRADNQFFIPLVFDIISRFNHIPGPMVWCFFTQFLWVHTFFVAGANFFRNLKFGWLFTTIFLLVLFIAGIQVLNRFTEGSSQAISFMENHVWPFSFVLLALSVFHVWLAYRLFSRRQLVGRFFNWI
jgi:hypothetical protein